MFQFQRVLKEKILTKTLARFHSCCNIFSPIILLLSFFLHFSCLFVGKREASRGEGAETGYVRLGQVPYRKLVVAFSPWISNLQASEGRVDGSFSCRHTHTHTPCFVHLLIKNNQLDWHSIICEVENRGFRQ